jgi:hypothetical protein
VSERGEEEGGWGLWFIDKSLHRLQAVGNQVSQMYERGEEEGDRGGGAFMNHCVDYKVLGIELVECREEVRRSDIGVVVHL